VRTFAPFVAGVGRMHYGTFQAWNMVGALAWVSLFVWGGYLIGNIPLIRDNFGLVTIGIIVVSLLPFVTMLLRRKPVAE
jgi:membrane-associated protein